MKNFNIHTPILFNCVSGFEKYVYFHVRKLKTPGIVVKEIDVITFTHFVFSVARPKKRYSFEFSLLVVAI